MLRHRRALAAAVLTLVPLVPLVSFAAPAGAAPTDGPPASATTYVVRNGDHLFAISRKTGVVFADLLAANGLSVGSVIHPGDVLTLPAPTQTPVAPGA